MSTRRGLLRRFFFDPDADPVLDEPVTDIVGIIGAFTIGVTIVITYDSAGERCAAWAIEGPLDTPPVLIGTFWSSVASPAIIPPIVSLADSYGKVFVAHDEPDISRRQITQVIDINASTIVDLAAGGTVGSIRFRRVRRHLNFIFGTGYGLDLDRDRPEIVRASIAGDPTNFDPEHYFIAGQRGDPVLELCPSGTILSARKQSESHDIVGNSRANFGIFPGDRNFGIAGSQLAVTVGSTSYFWSLEGPRMATGGGETTDLAHLLALAGPAPDALATDLDYEHGFAVYQPLVREVLFIFGTWAYVLHLADESAKRWSFRQFGVALGCGAVVSSVDILVAPSAHAEMTTPDVTDHSITAHAGIVGPLDGGEVAEWWLLDPNTGIFSLIATTPVDSLATTIEYTFDGLLPGIGYLMAVRLKRNGLAGDGYTSTNPNEWPATARATAVTDETGDPGSGDTGNLVNLAVISIDESGGGVTSTTIPVIVDLEGGTLLLDGTESIEYWRFYPTMEGAVGTQDAPAGFINNYTYTGLSPITLYGIAARLLRGGVPVAGYTSSDPLDWPSDSRLFTATAIL
jgi:hypothetical protein